ncbi:site-specific integrase [Salinarchaeum sp. IM2453]|uniref:tyrosine-type recombinase/integrase n=1 Tax=Salinarchaeum sp. IM2453 TaxID=2862870 RepID=UPI001C82D558|nr:tyrosine-type recombinase/integrase [Salinarchaeum sp. IM2453]QZA89551.1 site-specific integrase [Salinarchaeum sp. IM2453]
MGSRKRQKLERLQERIAESEELSEADRDALQTFDQELALRSSQYSTPRHIKLLRHCTIMAEEAGGLAEALSDKSATKNIVHWINKNYDNEETNRDYRVALRVFGRRATDENGSDPPATIDWVSSGTSKSYKPEPDPAKMLKWDDDIQPMIEACDNSRDRAMIAVAWDLGARSGEFRSIRVGDVSDHKHGTKVTVDGKTGQRSVLLIPSTPYLTRWLEDHPRSDDSTAPLWCSLSDGSEISYQMFRKIFRGSAQDAGVNKPVTLTNFRKSSASYLASQGLNQAHIEDHHGWVRGSDVASRYVKVFAEESDRELARAHGVDVSEDEPDPIAPMTCPRCGQETPREKDFCVWCSQALDQDAVKKINREKQQARAELLKLAREDPSILEDLENAERVLNLVEEDPTVLDEADRFLDALSSG